MGRKAFTLTELLVVVAGIAVVAAVLAPAAGGSREAGGYAACIGREKRIALGCALYVIDYDGYLPTNSPDGWCLPPGSTDGPVYPQNFAFGRLPGRDPEHDDGRTGLLAAYTSMAHWCNKVFPYVPSADAYLCEVRQGLVGPMHGQGRDNPDWGVPDDWWIGSVACEYGANSSLKSILKDGAADEPYFHIKQDELSHAGETILYGHANQGDRHVPRFTKACSTTYDLQWPAIYPHYWTDGKPGGRNGFIFGDGSVRGLTFEQVGENADKLFIK